METFKELGSISARERIVIILVIFLIRMLKPWTYDHQFTEFFSEIKLSMSKDFISNEQIKDEK